MRRTQDWPTLRATFEAQGFDLESRGLFGPTTYSPIEDAWEDWDRLAPLLKGGMEQSDWEIVEPYLAAIEEALAKRADLQPEHRSVRHGAGIGAAKVAVRGLAAGAVASEDIHESLRRLRLAVDTATLLRAGKTLLSVLLSVGAFHAIFEAAGGLVARRLALSESERLREIVGPLVFPHWREVALAELRYGLGWIERASAGGEELERDLGLDTDDPQFAGIRKLARQLARPDSRERGIGDRARAKVAAVYAKALLDPQVTDDLSSLDAIGPKLEPLKFDRFSPDAMTRAMAMTSGAWRTLPRLYRSVSGHRRMILLASLAAELPAGTLFAAVLQLRDSLGEEGQDPFLRNPIRVIDEGQAWAFYAKTVKDVTVLRLPVP